MRHQLLLIFLMLFHVAIAFSQERIGNSFTVAYTQMPELSDIEYKRYEIAGSYDLNKGKSGFFLSGLYRLDTYDFSVINDFNTSTFSKFHTLSMGAGYKARLPNGWQADATFTPTFSSNFEGKLTKEDFLTLGSLGLKKQWTKNNLYLGVRRDTHFGAPAFIPEIRWTTQWTQWEMILGFPYTMISYKKGLHNFALLGELSGSYQNNSDLFILSPQENFENTKYEIQRLYAGSQYTYTLNPTSKAIVKFGYVQNSNTAISSSTDTLLKSIESDNGLFMSMGLILNLN